MRFFLNSVLNLRRSVVAINILIALLFISPLLLAEAQDTNLESVSRAALQRVTDQVHEAKLSNGMRVLLYRRGDAPVFTGMVAARVGGSDEILGATGISHMLEHMAFKARRTSGRAIMRARPFCLPNLSRSFRGAGINTR